MSPEEKNAKQKAGMVGGQQKKALDFNLGLLEFLRADCLYAVPVGDI